MYKIGLRIFQIGELNVPNDFNLSEFVSLLDNGLKFIPCPHIKPSDLLYNTLEMFDSELLKFNFKLFYQKRSISKEVKDQIQLNSTFNCNFLDCILNKTRKKYKNIDKPFIQKEVFELRYKIIEEMPNCINKFKYNIEKIHS